MTTTHVNCAYDSINKFHVTVMHSACRVLFIGCVYTCVHVCRCLWECMGCVCVFVCDCLCARTCVHLCESYYTTNVKTGKCFNNSRILQQQNIIILLIVLT